MFSARPLAWERLRKTLDMWKVSLEEHWSNRSKKLVNKDKIVVFSVTFDGESHGISVGWDFWVRYGLRTGSELKNLARAFHSV